MIRYFSMFTGIGGFEIGIQNACGSPDAGEQTLKARGQGRSATRQKILVPRTDGLVNALQTSLTMDHYVLVSPRSTSTPSRFINQNMEDIKTMETQQQLIPGTFPTSTSSLAVFLAKVSAKLDSAVDSTTPEGLSSLTSLGFSSTRDPHIFYSKTSRVYLLTRLDRLSIKYLKFLPTWGIELNGNYLTARTSEYPRIASACSLSAILEENVDEKYYLSDTAIKRLLKFGIRAVDENGIAGTLKARTGRPQNDERYILDYKVPTSKTRRGRIKHGYTGALDTDVQQAVIEGARLRRLTPLECERLQGFPDLWTESGVMESNPGIDSTPMAVPISDNQRYKMAGNALTTNVVEALVREMI